MKVTNVHQRLFHAPPAKVGALIDALASPQDVLWRQDAWPRMKFDRPLGVGARGGHGPIRYDVEAYRTGHSIRFRFTGPKGLDGWHGLEVLEATGAYTVLEHRIEMRIRGWALLTWPLLYRHMHDALTEDAFAAAQIALGEQPRRVPWTRYVRLLRWAVALLRPRLVASQRSSHAS